MRHRIYLHVAWSTQDRRPLIDAWTAAFLAHFLPSVAREERCRIVELGLVATHVHALVRIHPSTSIPRLMQRLKGASAAIANKHERLSRGRPLRWAKGYNVESVSQRALATVRQYVRCQAEHHPDERIPGWPPKRNPEAHASL